MLFNPAYSPPTLTELGWHTQAPNDSTGAPAPDRITLRDAPAGGPERALRVELRPGDVNPVGNTARAEVYALHAVPGSTPAEQWPLKPESTYRLILGYYLQAPWPVATDTTWLVLSQVKGYKGGSPPIAVEAYKSRLRLKVTGYSYDLGPLPVGAWTTLDLTVRLSVHGGNDGDLSGWVSASRDGVVKVDHQRRHTLDTYVKDGVTLVDPVYLKQGVYRSQGAAWADATHVAWFAAPVVNGGAQ